MVRLFISHSSANDAAALALDEWLRGNGWSDQADIFLDIMPDRGLEAGARWLAALEAAAGRCEAVLFLVSQAWLSSKWCHDEYQLALNLNKKLFALLIEDVSLEDLPRTLVSQWQVVSLSGEPAERFAIVHPKTNANDVVWFSRDGLVRLKRGLDKAGLAPGTFELAPDPKGPGGWRSPYRGLEALQAEDAAVYFGRETDIIRVIDQLRGLRGRKDERLLTILGDSGTGKSSFLRAGLLPRLMRDDATWLPLKPLRQGAGLGGQNARTGGIISSDEGLLAALEELETRLRTVGETPRSRAELRGALETPEAFCALLAGFRKRAAARALLEEDTPDPVVILPVDQGEELFGPRVGDEPDRFFRLLRAATEAGHVVTVLTIRNDASAALRSESLLEGLRMRSYLFGPLPAGEIGRIIREPAKALIAKIGPAATYFHDDVIAALQAEMESERDALPLLALTMQRLIQEHGTGGAITLDHFHQTGGVAGAIMTSVDAAFSSWQRAHPQLMRSDFDRIARRLFIPWLVQVQTAGAMAKRARVSATKLSEQVCMLAACLVEERLLVASQTHGETEYEVAHEAVLRHWRALQEWIAEESVALERLARVQRAAEIHANSQSSDKQDLLIHRGGALAEARVLLEREDFREKLGHEGVIYLDACTENEQETRDRQRRLIGRAFVKPVQQAMAEGRYEAALRLAVAGLILSNDPEGTVTPELKAPALSAAAKMKVIWLLAGHEAGVITAAFSPDGARIVTASDDSTARVWDAATGAEIARLAGHEGGVTTAMFSPDGARILTASRDNTARIWDAATGAEIARLAGHESGVRTAAFSPDGARIVTASSDKTARVWDAATGAEIARLAGHESGVRTAAFSLDGTRIVTASKYKAAGRWRPLAEAQIARAAGDGGGVDPAAFSPDGARIVTASSDKTARVWDAATGAEIARLTGHQGGVSTAAFSPDGARIVTASDDETARVWGAATGAEIARLTGHEGHVFHAAFSHDGARVVTASDDTTARVWDAATGAEIVTLAGHHEGWFRTAAFSPDGARIVTMASSEMIARVWDISRTIPLSGNFVCVIGAALCCGIGKLSRDEQNDLLLEEASTDLLAEWMNKTATETAEDLSTRHTEMRSAAAQEIFGRAAAMRAPLHPNCYLSPTQFA